MNDNKYEYKYEVMKAVEEWIDEHEDEIKAWKDEYDEDEVKSYIYDDCFIDDGVTGNASGSFYCSTWQAESALCHNWDLINEAADEFDYDLGDLLAKGPETVDVIIRCYVLSEAIEHAIKNKELFAA